MMTFVWICIAVFALIIWPTIVAASHADVESEIMFERWKKEHESQAEGKDSGPNEAGHVLSEANGQCS